MKLAAGKILPKPQNRAPNTVRKVIRAFDTRPTAKPARPKARHRVLVGSLVLLVFAPLLAISIYMTKFAADQFVSRIGFAIRSENTPPISDVLSSFIGNPSSTANDLDILYEYIRGREMVTLVDQELDLRTLFSAPKNDPVFAASGDENIEELLRYWNRMIYVSVDSNSGLIEAEVTSFDSKNSHDIAQAIIKFSNDKINDLSKVAREDSIRFAREDLEFAIGNLRETRTRMTKFRIDNNLVDPEADIKGQMGVLNSLQAQLAEEMIENDLLRSSTSRANDPRLNNSDNRISIMRNRIDLERQKLSAGNGSADVPYAEVVSEYEGLIVDREFAEQRYLVARANYDAAVADANRISRYLAVFAPPLPAESPTRPRRILTIGLSAVLLLSIWSIASLMFYSIKDRR